MDGRQQRRRLPPIHSSAVPADYATPTTRRRLGILSVRQHADADADMFVAFSGTGEHVVGDGVPSEPCAPDQHVAVRTVCHGLDDAWADRDVAVPFFIAAMEATDGSESERYQGVLAGLLEGRTVCTGE